MTLEGVGPGSRIVVRHETGRVGPSGGPEMTDVIGHVRQIAPGSITVETRTGELRTIDTVTIVNLKQVPDAPPRRRRAPDARPQ